MRKYTVRKDTFDSRDYKLPLLYVKLPKYVDLRPAMPPIVNQGALGSCTANAIVSGLKEYMLRKRGNKIRLSRLFLYWYERYLEGTVNQDSGAQLRDGMKVLKGRGVSPEYDFPYDISTFRNKPSQQAVKDALRFRIRSYHRVLSLNALKTSIAQSKPVVFSFKVYESFESNKVARTGMVPMPNINQEQILGGHAVLAVGYNDAKQVVIVRNSWGTAWGQKGYCFMPYAMFKNRDLVMDMWTGN